MVEVLPTVPANDDGRIHPFFFRPSPIDKLPAPSGVALVRPDEVRKVQLPAGWGDWNDAKEI
jgi:hypothetical protein